jgi:hypothetical protein
MKSLSMAVFLVLLAAQASGGEARREHMPDKPLDDPTNGVFELQVVLQTNVATVGAELPAKVLLKNVGSGRQQVGEFKYSGDFAFQVRDSNGTNIPVSLEGKRDCSVSMRGGTAVELDPGQSRPYDYNFDNFFEFPATGGVFTLRAIRAKPPELYAIGIRPVPAGMLMITSPPVTFTLLPKPNTRYANAHTNYVTVDRVRGDLPVAIGDQLPEESKPAIEDKEGKWGPVVAGAQISIRFKKETFRMGDRIEAVILLRNASTNELQYITAFGRNEDFYITVIDDNGTRIAELANRRAASSGVSRLEAGTQHRFRVNLEDRFKLEKPGTYAVCVRRGIPDANERNVVDVPSSWAFISLVATAMK